VVRTDTLNVGTKELYAVELTDKLGAITDLAAYAVHFKILSEDEADTVVDWTLVNSKDGMIVYPLIDTTVGTWGERTYKMYIRATIPPEAPILGPIEFGLS
jgi:hypothetical protein